MGLLKCINQNLKTDFADFGEDRSFLVSQYNKHKKAGLTEEQASYKAVEDFAEKINTEVTNLRTQTGLKPGKFTKPTFNLKQETKTSKPSIDPILENAEIAVSEKLITQIMGKDFLKELGVDRKIPLKYKNDPRLELIGYRIPTSSKRLSAPLTISKVIPSGYGEAIMVSPELALQMGSDFDVDKLYLIRKDIQDGSPVSYDLDNIENLSNEETNNAIIDIGLSILRNTDQAIEMISPLTTAGVDEFVETMKKEYGMGENENSHMFSPGTNFKYEALNKFGGKGIGIAANSAAGHTIFQEIKPLFDLTNKVNIYQGKNKHEGTLDRTRTFNGKLILDNLEIWENIFLDNAKEPKAGYLNVNNMTVNPLLAMLLMGYDNDVAINLLNQPVIRDLHKHYLSSKENLEDAYSKLQKDYPEMFDPKNLSEAVNDKAYFVQAKELAGDINKDKYLARNDAQFINRQRQALEYFMKLQPLSEKLSRLSSLVKPEGQRKLITVAQLKAYKEELNSFIPTDTNKGQVAVPNIGEVYNVLTSSEEAIYNNPSAKLGASWRTMILGNLDLSKILFNQQSPAYDQVLSKIKSRLSFNRPLTAKQIQAIYRSTTRLLGLEAAEDSILKDYNWNELLFNKEESLAAELSDIKKKIADGSDSDYAQLQNNSLLLSLAADENNQYQYIQKIAYNNSLQVANERKNMITDDWYLLLRHKNGKIRNFAKKLVGYAIKTSGFGMHRGSFVELIPVNHFISSGFNESYKSLKGKDNVLLENSDFFDEYIDDIIRMTPEIVGKLDIRYSSLGTNQLSDPQINTDGVQDPNESDINDKGTITKLEIAMDAFPSGRKVGAEWIYPTFLKVDEQARRSNYGYNRFRSRTVLYKAVQERFDEEKGLGTVVTYKAIQPLAEENTLYEGRYNSTSSVSINPKYSDLPSGVGEFVSREMSDLQYDSQEDNDSTDTNLEVNLNVATEYDPLTNEQTEEIYKFLTAAGFSVEMLDTLKGKFNVDGAAAVDVLNKIIYLSKTDEGIRSLPEEVAHVYVEGLQSTRELNSLLSKVQELPEYQEVVEEYKELYNNDELKLKKEAAAKVIAKYMIKTEPAPKNWLRRLLQRLQNTIKKLFGKTSPFELAAQNIMQQPGKTASSLSYKGGDVFFNVKKNNKKDPNENWRESQDDIDQRAEQDALINAYKNEEMERDPLGLWNAGIVSEDFYGKAVASLAEGLEKEDLFAGRDFKKEIENLNRSLFANINGKLESLNRTGVTGTKDFQKAIKELIKSADLMDTNTQIAKMIDQAETVTKEIIRKFDEHSSKFADKTSPEGRLLEEMKILDGYLDTLSVFDVLEDNVRSIFDYFNELNATISSQGQENLLPQQTIQIKEFLETSRILLAGIDRISNSKKVLAIQSKLGQLGTELLKRHSDKTGFVNQYKKPGESVDAALQRFVKEEIETTGQDIGVFPYWAVGLQEHKDAILSFIGYKYQVAEKIGNNNFLAYHRGNNEQPGGAEATKNLIKFKNTNKLSELYEDFIVREKKYVKSLKGQVEGNYIFISENSKSASVVNKYKELMALEDTDPRKVFYNTAIRPYIEKRRKLYDKSPAILNYAIPEAIPKVKRRLHESVADPNGDVTDGIKQSLNDTFIIQRDDSNFNKYDENGNRINAIPYHYNSKRIGPDEVSLDIYTSLQMAMGNLYQNEQNEKLLPLFKAGLVLLKNRKLQKEGSKVEFEDGKPVLKPFTKETVPGDQTKAYKKLKEMMHILVYGQIEEDDATVTVMGRKVSLAKTAEKTKQAFSFINLAGNVFSMIVNPVVQLYVQSRRAMGGQDFTWTAMRKGYQMFTAAAPRMALDYHSKNPKSKEVLLMESYGVFEDGIKNLSYSLKGNFFKNFLNKVGYMGFKIGNAAIQPSVVLGILSETKINIDGKETSVWEEYKKSGSGVVLSKKAKEALSKKFKVSDGEAHLQALVHKEVTRISDIHRVSDKGVYQKTIIGKFMAMHRGWMLPVILNSYYAHRYNHFSQKPEEGINTTGFKAIGAALGIVRDKEGKVYPGALTPQFLKNLFFRWSNIKAGDPDFLNPSTKKPFTEAEIELFKSNMKQFYMHLATTAMLVGASIKLSDDEEYNDSYGFYLLLRMKAEITNTLDPSEALTVLDTPSAAVRSTSSMIAAMTNLLIWNDKEIESGYWKGKSYIERDLSKILPLYNQYHSFNNVEDKIKYMKSIGFF